MKDIKLLTEKIVTEAGKLMLRTINQEDIQEKSGTANFVTSIDIAVEAFIVERLKEILPESNIITEESEGNQFNFEKPTWILDPVDGTTNLMYGYNHSAISLGLFIEGKPYIGVVYDPYKDELFSAQRGNGAFVNERPIKVTDTKRLSDCVTSFGSTPYDRSATDKSFRILKEVFENSRDIRRSGSAALDICYVASGRIDGFFELKLQPWDFAAGVIILEEAGGSITNWEGAELGCLVPDSVIATNGHIHDELGEWMK